VGRGYSLQFEIGPLSEASIGNVGMRPETTGWVDHVVTPAGALGLMVAEDALDRYSGRMGRERGSATRVWRASLRLIFNPARTLSNAASGRRRGTGTAGRSAGGSVSFSAGVSRFVIFFPAETFSRFVRLI
jgi:hypothetical protein